MMKNEQTLAFLDEVKMIMPGYPYAFEYHVCENDTIYYQLCVREGASRFTPTIYMDEDWDNDGKLTIRIQTTSYGAVPLEDYGEFVEAVKMAEVIGALIVGLAMMHEIPVVEPK